MAISAESIKTIRETTGVGIMDAKKALEEAGGNVEQAITELRKQGAKVMTKKQDRHAGEGWVGSYVHHNGKVAALVELRCETDFVARNEAFKELAKQLAMQVAASAPAYVNQSDVPDEEMAKEESIVREQLAVEGKPAEMIEKIITGKLQKYYSQVCLLEQPFFLDDKQTIKDLLAAATLKLGEKIEVTRFVRFAF